MLILKWKPKWSLLPIRVPDFKVRPFCSLSWICWINSNFLCQEVKPHFSFLCHFSKYLGPRMGCMSYISTATTWDSALFTATLNIPLLHPSAFTVAQFFWHRVLWSSWVPVSLGGLLWRLVFAWPMDTRLYHYWLCLPVLGLVALYSYFPWVVLTCAWLLNSLRLGLSPLFTAWISLPLLTFLSFWLVLKNLSFSLLKSFLGIFYNTVA